MVLQNFIVLTLEVAMQEILVNIQRKKQNDSLISTGYQIKKIIIIL